mgnify:CR=1 FL=1
MIDSSVYQRDNIQIADVNSHPRHLFKEDDFMFIQKTLNLQPEISRNWDIILFCSQKKSQSDSYNVSYAL